jgi:iron complex transport system permease protein
MKRGFGLVALAVAAVLAILVSVRYGAVGLDARQVVRALAGDGDPAAVTIVRELRLPRAVLAALVGGALALAGATFQALLRNPLAEPYLLGVSSGAGAGAVAAIALGLIGTALGIPAGALVGSLVAIALVLAIALQVDRRLDLRVLLLAGVVTGSFFNAVILLLLAFQEAEAFRSALFWMVGSVAGASWERVALLGGAIVPALGLLLALSRPLDLLGLGEETAGYLGAATGRVQRAAYLTASLLTAIAVVTAGALGFVGLVVPHTVRMVWGGGHRFLLPASFLAGAAALPLADTVARTVAAPAELPLGVVTAFVGVPFFLWLLRRQAGRAAP